MAKPVLVMLLSRQPYVEKSGRGFTLRQRIEQARRRFDVRLVVLGAPSGDTSDQGLIFLPMAEPVSLALNAVRLMQLPLQTWLYYSARARAAIARLAAESGAAAVYVDLLRLAPLTEGLPPNIARILDYDDVFSVRYRNAAAKNYDIMGFLAQRVGALAPLARACAPVLLRVEASRCDAYERRMASRCDLVVLVSPTEARLLDRPGVNILVAPPVVEPIARMPPPGRRLIFLGNNRYAENISMLRDLASALNELDAALPDDAVLDVVGDHAPDLPSQLSCKRLNFLGRVANLDDLAGAGVFLAPVMSGSGVKLKVLDGMALGCPVVATPKALEGIGARANRDLLIAKDAKAVLKAALALRDRQTLKAALARRARLYIQRAHGSEIGDRFCAAIEAAIAAASRRQDTL
jgi:glycosyltransferase involved in cell wall biosynthesis